MLGEGDGAGSAGLPLHLRRPVDLGGHGRPGRGRLPFVREMHGFTGLSGSFMICTPLGGQTKTHVDKYEAELPLGGRNNYRCSISQHIIGVCKNQFAGS